MFFSLFFKHSNSLTFDALGSRSSLYGGIKFGYPLKTVNIIARCTLIHEVAAPMLSLVSRATAQISCIFS